jgi:hypothetical protein
MGVRRERTRREEWKEGRGVPWIFKPKRQNVFVGGNVESGNERRERIEWTGGRADRA